MNNKKFFESFSFRAYCFDKDRHTDNLYNNGLASNHICMLYKGSAKLVSKKETVTLNANDFFIIPKDYPYRSYWYTDENSEVMWYSFGADYLPILDGGNYRMQKFEVDDTAREIFNKITKNLNVTTENIGLLYLFLSKVSSNLVKDGTNYDASISKALEYMQANSSSKMSEVAKACNISEATLYTLFKKRFKKTPNEIRQKILCEKAEELLITTSLSIEEICDKLGFSSSSYFRKILKKHLNTTPSTIRKNSL